VYTVSVLVFVSVSVTLFYLCCMWL